MEQVALMNQGQPGQNPAALMELFKQMKESSSGAIMIRVNEPDGLLMVGRSDSSALQLAPALTIAPAALLAAIAVPNFMEAQTRSKVSRAKADMRTMATALECYYIDNNSYAATSVDPARNAYGSLGQSDPALRQQPTFMTSSPERAIMTLTTPVAYITGYMPDPFKKDKGATFSYYTTGTGWILWSPGPDGKYELNQENIGKLYDPSGKVPAADLIERTFDPTNGTASPGDIWRTKQ